ncbi:MAG: hypothetical protein FJY76_00220 [Candidatus Aenigmarchaeota archaeon]|nr:hypothetical protein [Candidatus Aenigmarchaeota archaeon]
MKPRLIVSDWNGTLISDRDDKPVLKQMAMDELKHCAKRPWLWGRVMRLAMLRGRMEGMVAQYRDDPQSQAELLRATYELFNTEVIDGIPMERIDESIRRYAEKALFRLDGAFYEVFGAGADLPAPVEILTSALQPAVTSVVQSGLSTRKYGSFNINGSRINKRIRIKDHSITAGGIELRNYDDKADRLRELGRFNDHDIVYMGDDMRDATCATVADIFVVSPLATDEFRQHMSKKYGCMVRTPAGTPGEVYKALTKG